MRYPEYLLKLIGVLRKLPGVGSKTAERFAFQMLDWPEERLEELAKTVLDVKEKICYCSTCGALLHDVLCQFCAPSRQADLLCVVASIKDIFSMEGTKSYRGLYHVLGDVFSPILGKFPNEERITLLKERITTLKVKEVIIALDATFEGDATALFLKKELSSLNIPLTRLAFGLPIGSSLDFIDEGTLSQALTGRGRF